MMTAIRPTDEEVSALDVIRAQLPKGLLVHEQNYQLLWRLDDRLHKSMTKCLANNRKYDRDAAIHTLRLTLIHLESMNKQETE